MIGYIKGNIKYIDNNKFIIENSGIGYIVNVSSVLLGKYKSGEEIELYIQPEIREDAFDFFGFLNLEEKDFYKKLRTVNGVGPKTALGIMSIDLNELLDAIQSEDMKKLTSVPGLGKKTAERLILELKGTLPVLDKLNREHRNINDDVISALENFGYKKRDIVKILENEMCEKMSAEEMIKFFLQQVR